MPSCCNPVAAAAFRSARSPEATAGGPVPAMAAARALVPGREGGTGGGPFGLGTQVVSPTLLISQEPKYTSKAMQAKVQGIAEVEAVVLPNGTIGDVRLVKSLDPAFGLDDEAIKCARLWLFRPGRDRQGRAVSSVVRIQLEFVLR